MSLKPWKMALLGLYIALGTPAPAFAGPCDGYLMTNIGILSRSIRQFVYSSVGRPFISDFWLKSNLATRDQNGHAVLRVQLDSNFVDLPIAFWNRDGNPVILVSAKSEAVKFRSADYSILPGHLSRQENLNEPLFGYLFPDLQKMQLNVVITNGHGRFAMASQQGKDVYIELFDVRPPHPHEQHYGNWYFTF